MSALEEAKAYRERAIDAAGGYGHATLRETALALASHIGVPLDELMAHLERVNRGAKRNTQLPRGPLAINAHIEGLFVGYALAKLEDQA